MRKLLNGNEVQDEENADNLLVYTKCPTKYKLVDMETGEKIKLQTAEIKELYVEGIQKYFNEISLRCANHRIDFMPADINEGYDQVLLQYLLKRQKMN